MSERVDHGSTEFWNFHICHSELDSGIWLLAHKIRAIRAVRTIRTIRWIDGRGDAFAHGFAIHDSRRYALAVMQCMIDGDTCCHAVSCYDVSPKCRPAPILSECADGRVSEGLSERVCE